MSEFSSHVGQPDQLFKQIVAHYDVPAFARRARRVEEAHAELLERCRAQREEWLEVVRLRVQHLCTSGNTDEELCELAAALGVPLSAAGATNGQRQSQRARAALVDSIERFNRRWTKFLDSLDLGPLNRLREDYNRYYLLEKECALRSARLARVGFVPLRPIGRHDLAAQFPILLVPGQPRN
ncbi:MAG: hypothetical protein FJ271_29055 [Planctomycetes bacterium]|nr:hypothetical protein [Planctomycetota bacterium]